MKALRGDSLQIGIFGRRNAGKSSVLNALTQQQVAIVSATPGTTTDPVFKAMELLPLGPVVFIDTAGIDDSDGSLGSERIRRTEQILSRTDLALLLVPADARCFADEDRLLSSFEQHRLPFLVVINKSDRSLTPELLAWLGDRQHCRVSALHNHGIEDLSQAIVAAAPTNWEPPLLRDLFNPGDVVLLITPIDRSAPKGRLIMPQVKAIRETLDGHGVAMVTTELEAPAALAALRSRPVLAVTDSQVFGRIAPIVPPDIPLTSFSILSIRQKGDLAAMVAGVMAVKSLQPGDRVLIAEGCTHHPTEDDIGRQKIPRWLAEYVGGPLDINVVAGSNFPDDLSSYRLVVHCGACTLNRREVLRRQSLPTALNIPMTNFGVLLAFLKGAFPRALEPFPEIYAQVS